MTKKDSKPNVSKSKTPLFISLGIISVLILMYFFVPSYQQFLDEAWQVLTSNDERRIEDWVSDFGWLGPVVLILAMVVQMFLIVIPSLALMVVSVIAYGPVWGSLISVAGVFTASTIGYIIGNYFGPVLVKKLIGPASEEKIERFINDYGFWAVVITRFNPFLSNDAISFVGGVLKMGYWRFISATLVGISPLVIFIAILGNNTEHLKTGLIWGSGISLVLFLLYVWWDKRRNSSN
jgi:uncharacterized membrane protein YdjX (TVP38/TMEM64 family)